MPDPKAIECISLGVSNYSLHMGEWDNYLHFIQELGSARLCDGAQVVDQVGLGHTDTGVGDVQHPVVLVGLDPDGQLRVGRQDLLVGQGEEPDFVEGV